MTNLDWLSFCGQGLQSSVALVFGINLNGFSLVWWQGFHTGVGLVFAMAGQKRQNKRRDVRIRNQRSVQQRQKGSDQKREAGSGR